ncbi:MAG: hypothetical protein AB1768_20725, partial [Pseudomonadota bacterium]
PRVSPICPTRDAILPETASLRHLLPLDFGVRNAKVGSSILLRSTKIPEPGRSPGFFAPEKNASFRKDLAKPAKGARGGEPPVWPGLGLFFLSVLRFCEGRPSHDPTD